MERLPVEMAHHVLSFLDEDGLYALLAVNALHRSLGQYEIRRRRTRHLDFVKNSTEEWFLGMLLGTAERRPYFEEEVMNAVRHRSLRLPRFVFDRVFAARDWNLRQPTADSSTSE